MLEQITAEQLEEWQEYAKLEPFGQPWRRHSLMTARMLNQMMSMMPRKEGAEPLKFYEDENFVPGYVDKREEVEQQAAIDAASAMEGFGV